LGLSNLTHQTADTWHISWALQDWKQASRDGVSRSSPSPLYWWS